MTKRSIPSDLVRTITSRSSEEVAKWSPLGELPPALQVDNWVAKSALQKAVRRGDERLALSAAQTLFSRQPGGLIRRLAIIAMEDVGIGNDGLVIECMAACLHHKAASDPVNPELPLYLASSLANSVKDRSTDDIYEAVVFLQEGKDVASVEREALSFTTNALIRLLEDASVGITSKAIVVLALEKAGQANAPRIIDPLSLPWAAYRELGVPDELVSLCQPAARFVQDVLAVLLPLVWIEAERAERRITKDALTVAPTLRGVPAFCLDQFTSSGKAAIARFVETCGAVRDMLLGSGARELASAGNAAVFRVEGGQCDQRLAWAGGRAIYQAADCGALGRYGVRNERVADVLSAIRLNLGQLHEIRARLFDRPGRIATEPLPAPPTAS